MTTPYFISPISVFRANDSLIMEKYSKILYKELVN